MLNGNQPAYPNFPGTSGDMGLTKLEFISAMVLQGMLSNPANNSALKEITTAAIVQARELLTQLESKPEPEVKHTSEDIAVDPCAHENKTFTDGITNCFDCGKIL